MNDNEPSDFEPGEPTDNLEASVREIAESVPVRLLSPEVPKEAARRRTRNTRIAAGSVAGLALVAGGLQLTDRPEPSMHLETINTTTPDGTGDSNGAASSGVASSGAVLNNAGNVQFGQRIVEGDIGYAEWSTTTDDGVVYALSTPPSLRTWRYENGKMPPQALFSSSDGENWSAVELGDRRVARLSANGGLLYALSSSEATNGNVTYSLGASPDGGVTWEDTDLPVDLERPVGPAYEGVNPYLNVDLAITDGAFLASIQSHWQPNEEWLLDQLGVTASDGIGWEYSETGVVAINYEACMYEGDQLEQIFAELMDEAMSAGMTEAEAEEWVASRMDDEPAAMDSPSVDSPSVEPTSMPSPAMTTTSMAPVTTALDAYEEEAVSVTAVEDGDPGLPTATTLGSVCGSGNVIAEKSYAELGIEQVGFAGSFYGLLSTDGQTWSRVDLPGPALSVVGDRFVSTEWTEFGQTVSFSDDGETWGDPVEQTSWNRTIDGSIGDRLAGFRFDYGFGGEGELTSEFFESPEQVENASREKLFFGTSADGENWTETLIFEGAEGPSESWIVAQHVGPLGAFALVETHVYEQGGSSPLMPSTTMLEESITTASYFEEEMSDSYQDNSSYSILYSKDGVDWQSIELDEQPGGYLTWSFMTNDSIGLSFQGVGEPGKTPRTETVLLTPQR